VKVKTELLVRLLMKYLFWIALAALVVMLLLSFVDPAEDAQ